VTHAQIPFAAAISDLSGKNITLQRIRASQLDALWAATEGRAAEVFRWYTFPITSKEQMQAWFDQALNEEERGVSIAYVTIENGTGKLIGSTRFMTIEREHRSVEIGNTWLGPSHQRTAANTEAKYLMMRTAFEDWGCRRVGLKTDSRNEKSRTAMLRIGAKEEGTLRNHMVRFDGGARHSVFFSVIAEEWPAVKAGLERRLAGGPQAL
jgi:N-acetyltransferase